MSRKPDDMKGKKFNKLTFIERTTEKSGLAYLWLCECECGNQVKIIKGNVVNGNTKSCGCLKLERVSDRFRKHGYSRTPLYYVWLRMKARCFNNKCDDYKNYGGRGIKVCDEWKNNFVLFHDWSMENGYKKGLTIDRINNDGNYEPSNCRWATYKEQANNRRKRRI